MSDMSSIPKPRIALQIGVVGHRDNKLTPEMSVNAEVTFRAIYAAIDHGVAAVARTSPDWAYAALPPSIRVVTGLAMGADRLGVTAAPKAWEIEAVLPMPREDYALDFTGPDAAPTPALADYEMLLAQARSVTELPSLNDHESEINRVEQYEALGEFLIRQIDLLVALWDGQKADGPGGTVYVIARALALRRPVIWINPADPGEYRILRIVDTTGEKDPVAEPLDAAGIADLIALILRPPGSENTGAQDEGVVPPRYLREPWPHAARLAFAYPLLRRACGIRTASLTRRHQTLKGDEQSWDPFFEKAPRADGAASGSISDRLRTILLPRSIWADALAWYYAQLYRSAYVTTFILGGIAVPIGLCYLFFQESPFVIDIKAGFSVAELLIIGVIMFVVRRGHRREWHRLWLETRELSELLRLGRSLAYIGALRDIETANPSRKETRENVQDWYVRATFREIGLPHGVLNRAYLIDLLRASRDTEIAEQTGYHRANETASNRLDRTLHSYGNACFLATIVVIAIYLVVWLADHLIFGAVAFINPEKSGEHGFMALLHEFLLIYLKPFVSIAAAALPAFGAALAGIRAQGDFKQIASRSEQTNMALLDATALIDRLVEHGHAVTLANTREVLLNASFAMSEDVVGWRRIHLEKHLTLPA